MTQEPTNQDLTIQFRLDWLKLLSIGLAVVGFLGLLQLAWGKFVHATNICPFNSGMPCELVVRSVYSQVGPLPVSYLGLTGFLLIVIALLFEARLLFGRIIVFGLMVSGFLFTVYLTAIEAFVLHTWCQLCLFIALIMTCLFVVSFIRVWRAISIIPEDEELDDETL